MLTVGVVLFIAFGLYEMLVTIIFFYFFCLADQDSLLTLTLRWSPKQQPQLLKLYPPISYHAEEDHHQQNCTYSSPLRPL